MDHFDKDIDQLVNQVNQIQVQSAENVQEILCFKLIWANGSYYCRLDAYHSIYSDENKCCSKNTTKITLENQVFVKVSEVYYLLESYNYNSK